MGATPAIMTTFRLDPIWIRRLFFALALAYVVPFWTVRYLPMTDGPNHTANAWIVRQHGNVEQYPLFNRYYEINWRPYPNWAGVAVMATLMFVVPPLIAQKLLASAIVLLLLGGAWALAGVVRPEERWPAFLAFPFAHHQFLQFGFFNFSISVGFCLVTLAYWWRHRESPSLRFAVVINLLLWLCWFSHVFSFALALLAIGVLWLATFRPAAWRRHLLHVALLLPQLALPLWFFRVEWTGVEPMPQPFLALLHALVPPQVMFSFSRFQLQMAAVLAAAFLILLVLTFWRHTFGEREGRRLKLRPTDAFLLVVLVLLALYFCGPEGLAHGSLITGRLSLFIYLLLIPWLAPRLDGWWKAAGVFALTLLALVNLVYQLRWHHIVGEEVRQFVAGLEPVQPNSRVLSLLFRRQIASENTDVFSHAAGYVAMEKGLIDWDNYEAKEPHFSTRFRKSVVFPYLPGILLDPGSYRVRVNRDSIDAIYTWQMPPDAPLRTRLRRSYRLTSRVGGGELWQRRGHPRR
jgi:hypothetical protein